MSLYLEVHVDPYGDMLQHIEEGQVVSYIDKDGTFLFDSIPTGLGSYVVSPDPYPYTEGS